MYQVISLHPVRSRTIALPSTQPSTFAVGRRPGFSVMIMLILSCCLVVISVSLSFVLP